MDDKTQPSRTIGFRAQTDAGQAQQSTGAPWDKFTRLFSKPRWTFPNADSGNEHQDYSDDLEQEYTGDGTRLQLATGSDVTQVATQVHALLIEVSGLSKEQLLDRIGTMTAVGHTLCRHTPNEPDWRIIIPLARPVSVATADTAHKRFFAEQLAGGTVYNETEQGRWFLRPGCRKDLLEHFDHFKVDGVLVDVEAVLDGKQNWDGSVKTLVTPPAADEALPAAAASAWTTATDADLRLQLENLYSSLIGAEDFETVGKQILEVELELNRRKRWAPAFRPSASIPGQASKRLPVHKMIQQMRVVIDCHWLHTQLQRCPTVKEARWRALLDPRAPFPFELAKEFAERAIDGATRADEVLNLTPVQQAQVRSMCGKRIREARKTSEDARPTGGSPLGRSLKAINQWAASDPRVNVEKYEALARAVLLLDGEKHSNADLGALVGLALSEAPLAENRIRSMKKRLAQALSEFS